MIDPEQFLRYAVQPVLAFLEMDSPSARALVLGTAVCESGLSKLSQRTDKIPGPGLGLYQMERATHDDLWHNYILVTDGGMVQKVQWLMYSNWTIAKSHDQLIHNLAYATAMCRIHYWRVSRPLPQYKDWFGLAAYWKDHYNTRLGAGTPDDFMNRTKIIQRMEFDYDSKRSDG